MTCFSQWGDQRGLKNADFFNKSYSLKIVIFPWKFLEKSLKFICLKLYEPVPIVARKGCIENWVKEAGVQHDTFHVKT